MSRQLRIKEIERGSATLEFRRVVLPILAISEATGKLHPIGSCFVITCLNKRALALTASHLVDYVRRIDGERPIHASSTPPEFVQRHYKRRVWKNLKVYTLLATADERFVPCFLDRFWYFDPGPDIAVVGLILPEQYEYRFTHRLRISSKGPCVGDQILALGYLQMETSDEVIDQEEIISEQSLSVPLKQMPASVKNSHGIGDHHLVKWPCFEIDAPLDPGMSGGPVVLKRDENYVAVGVVSAGSSFDPRGVASNIYPSLHVNISGRTLADLISRGMITDIDKGHRHIQLDGCWSSEQLLPIRITMTSRRALEGFRLSPEVFEMDRFPVQFGPGCLSLGQCFRDRGDESHVLLISEEIVEAAEAMLAEGSHHNINLVKIEFPYAWLKVGDHFFRTLAVVIPGSDDTLPIKILTDAHEIEDGLPLKGDEDTETPINGIKDQD
jgi:hypothetical protein